MPTMVLPTAMLAALYISLPKLLTVTALAIGSFLALQWVDRDVERINKPRREWWNLLVLSGNIAAFVVLVLIPWPGAAFFLGLAFWLVAATGPVLAYVVHRNGRVGKSARVLTPAHFKRLLAGKKGGGRRRKTAASGCGW
jgi:archaellum biogenesis protein FlaJ (TadC family)